jgi:hypothetical protein
MKENDTLMGFSVTKIQSKHFRTKIGKLGMNLLRAFLNLERVISLVSRSWKTNEAPKIHGPVRGDCEYRWYVTERKKRVWRRRQARLRF